MSLFLAATKLAFWTEVAVATFCTPFAALRFPKPGTGLAPATAVEGFNPTGRCGGPGSCEASADDGTTLAGSAATWKEETFATGDMQLDSDAKDTFTGDATGLKSEAGIEGTDTLLVGNSISESSTRDLSM